MRLQRISEAKKAQRLRYKEMNEKLNDQALHMEILINKLRPDLGSQPTERPDIRNFGDNPEQLARDILV